MKQRPKWALTPGQLELLEEAAGMFLCFLQASAVLLFLGIFIECLLAVPQPI